MNTSTHDQAVYWLLMQVMIKAKHRVHHIAEQYGLTLVQSNALMTLLADEPMPMNAMSTVLMCDASNVTGITDRLEKQGLIQRRDHPTDRRIKMIAVTPAGIKLKEKIVNELIATEAALLDPILTDADRKTLAILLQRILDAHSETSQ